METLGKALAFVVYVVMGVLYIPFAIAYHVVTTLFAVAVFGFCAMLVMVYKLAAWLSRLTR